MIPDDPLGRNGPHLDIFLRRDDRRAPVTPPPLSPPDLRLSSQQQAVYAQALQSAPRPLAPTSSPSRSMSPHPSVHRRLALTPPASRSMSPHLSVHRRLALTPPASRSMSPHPSVHRRLALTSTASCSMSPHLSVHRRLALTTRASRSRSSHLSVHRSHSGPPEWHPPRRFPRPHKSGPRARPRR
ncbi:serine/arginine repetitive matrix protein 1-like [Pseudoliparis swirei]|uniref:serine/arginine repetitive matrix protein 1-like n=1 Tax=Pseudoliparis swirei TaxID=2059687 RepID=UPI0024BEA5DB|nr:serine/arginine repetitive matrix protein 1-like [Pseudoliparis swirei]